jgi:hypothetical protein
MLVDTVSVAVIGIGLCAPMLLAWIGNKGAKVKKPSPEEFEENYPEACEAEEPTEESFEAEEAELPERSSSREVTPNEAEGSPEENPAYSTVDI